MRSENSIFTHIEIFMYMTKEEAKKVFEGINKMSKEELRRISTPPLITEADEKEPSDTPIIEVDDVD